HRRQGQGAGHPQMLVGFSDLLDRQDPDVEITGQTIDECLEHATVDRRVDANRQMRPVLLDGGDRQDGDSALWIEAFEFTRGVFVPPDPAARLVHVRFLLTPDRAVAARKTMMSDYGITEPLTMVRAEPWTGFSALPKRQRMPRIKMLPDDRRRVHLLSAGNAATGIPPPSEFHPI